MSQDQKGFILFLAIVAGAVGIYFIMHQKPPPSPPEGGGITGTRNPVPVSMRFRDGGRVLLVTNTSEKHLHAVRIWGGGNSGEITTLNPHETQELQGNPPEAKWNDFRGQAGFYLFAKCNGYDTWSEWFSSSK